MSLMTNFQTMELISPGLRLMPTFANQLQQKANAATSMAMA